MTWREVREADLRECISIGPSPPGDKVVVRDRAVGVWKELIRSRSFNSCIIESEDHPGQIVGFGATLFVTPDFATSEIENPKPGLCHRIIAKIGNGESVMRREADLYNTSAHNALDLATLSCTWKEGVLNPDQLRRVQMLLASSFVSQLAGYRLNRLFAENIGRTRCDFIESSRVWQVTRRFAGGESHFAVMTRKDAFAVSGSLAAYLFQYQEPMLRLNDKEKHMLVEALTRRSDNDLAKAMNLSPATIKKRWQSLFEKVAETRPEILPLEEEESLKQSRGPQKRHHILAYVRSHPQELRPYRWRSHRDA
jgi:hypothetical protein